jgi:hypothetical protein
MRRPASPTTHESPWLPSPLLAPPGSPTSGGVQCFSPIILSAVTQAEVVGCHSKAAAMLLSPVLSEQEFIENNHNDLNQTPGR